MEIISRQEAKKQGEITYFTGLACKNSHVAYRYVKNGACSECVKLANGYKPEPEQAARKEVKAQLVQVRIRIYDEDRENVAVAAWALAAMRWPVLTQGDVDPQLLPKDRTAGTGLYAFYCHKDDIDAIRELGADSIRRRSFNAEAARAQALKAAGELAL